MTGSPSPLGYAGLALLVAVCVGLYAWKVG